MSSMNLSKADSMKEILHKKRDTLNRRGKIVTIEEHSEDQECITLVRKNFIYVLGPTVDTAEELVPPEIKIKKSFFRAAMKV